MAFALSRRRRDASLFRSLITAETLIPLADYLAFHDELVRPFYKDDDGSHFALGRESARWALVDGPRKAFLDQRDLCKFVGSFSRFWETYFSETTSRSQASRHGDSVEFKTFDLPQWHPYFEHFVMGYMTEELEMFCANPIGSTRLRGGGGKSYHYLLHTAPAALERSPDHAALRAAAARPWSVVTSRTGRSKYFRWWPRGRPMRRSVSSDPAIGRSALCGGRVSGELARVDRR